MKSGNAFALVLVTAPDLKVARRLAQSILRTHLAACANLIPRIESHYWWQNKMAHDTEVLILFKTRRSCLAKLEKQVLAQHPYDTPEFLVVPLQSGNARYLEWLSTSTAGSHTENFSE